MSGLQSKQRALDIRVKLFKEKQPDTAKSYFSRSLLGALIWLRLLRNSLCHADRSEIDKPTFDQYVQLAKEAFKALGIITDPIDAIGGLTESDFPTKEVRKLEESLRQETRSYIECLEELRSGVECLEEVKSGVDKLIAQGNAIKEKVDDLALLKGEIDDLKLNMDEDQTGIN